MLVFYTGLIASIYALVEFSKGKIIFQPMLNTNGGRCITSPVSRRIRFWYSPKVKGYFEV